MTYINITTQPSLLLVRVGAGTPVHTNRLKHRADIMGVPTKHMDYITALKCAWNLTPCFISGYFDDGMAGGPLAAIQTVDRAVAYIMHTVGVKGSCNYLVMVIIT